MLLVSGTLHNLEVTYNRHNDDYHPHRHALLEAPFLDQDAVSWDWSCCLAEAGFPVRDSLVYLSRIKPNKRHRRDPHDDNPSSSLTDAIFEVSKYLAKPADAYDGEGFPTRDLPHLIAAMRSLRSSDATGSIKRALQATKPEPPENVWYWLGTLPQLKRAQLHDDLADSLRAAAGNKRARTVLARKYNLRDFQPPRNFTAQETDHDEPITDHEQAALAEQLDLLPLPNKHPNKKPRTP